MTETHGLDEGPSHSVCVHDDRCTVGGGHSGPCTRISPGQQGGRLERALWRIVAAIVGIVVVAVAGVIALGYGILRGG